MQFKLTAVFIAVLYAAFVFATCSWPTQYCYDVVNPVYVIGYASALVVTYHAMGRLRAFCFAFATFGFLVGWGASFCPEMFAIWVGENFAHPTAKAYLNEYYYTVEGVLDCHITFLVAFIAGSISQSVSSRKSHRGSAVNDCLTSEPHQSYKEQN